MIFVLFSANILLVLTVCSDAKPTAFDGSAVRLIEIPDQFVAEESHPYEVAINPGPQLEETDDDQYAYEESAPVRVVAVPQSRPQVYRLMSNGQDLSASASDLQASASHYGGHGGGGGGGYGGGHGGWLDMGAYSSGKGAFGW